VKYTSEPLLPQLTTSVWNY